MNIKKNCGCDSKAGCGCGDHVYTTNKCNTPSCATPEECAEQFSSNCVLYMGPTIANLNIYKGDLLSTVIQKLTNAIVNINCASPTAPCQSVNGIYTTSIGTTSIGLKWDIVDTGVSYAVEYRAVDSPTWLSLAATTGNTATISGLSSNVQYAVRIKSTCADPYFCYSLTLLITTKS